MGTTRELYDASTLLDKYRNSDSLEQREASLACGILSDVSVRVVDYRVKHGLSQAQLAQRLGVSQAMVSKYESGSYNFTIEKLAHLCCVLDMTLRMLISPSWKEGGNRESSLNNGIGDEIIG